MDIAKQACVWVFLLAAAAHIASVWKLQARVDDLADQGKLSRGGLTFVLCSPLVMLRSIDELLRRTVAAPDRKLNTWANLARTTFYVSMLGGFGAFFIQALW